ncbi:MAG: hypothetical protein MJK12_11110 [Colwellia sp.]|nr:hypothetical protein [Colwellia sp.]
MFRAYIRRQFSIIITLWHPFFFTAEEANRTYGIELFEAKKFTNLETFSPSYSRQNPHHSNVHHYLRQIMIAKNQFEQIIELFRQSIAIEIKHLKSWSDFGMANFKQAENMATFSVSSSMKNGCKCFDKFLGLSPDNLTAFFYLANDYALEPSLLCSDTKMFENSCSINQS